MLIACEVVVKERLDLHDDYFLLILDSDTPLKAKPGQFVLLRIKDTYYPLLPRPMSIFNEFGSIVTLFIKKRGEFTKILGKSNPGEKLLITGPLGNGFPETNSVILVGGGTGVAPLYFYAASFPERVKSFFIGFPTRPHSELIKYLEFLGNRGVKVVKASEDGSWGEKGTVVELVKKQTGLAQNEFFVCGPTPMLTSLTAFLPPERTYLSLEGMMGCGTGICMSCGVKKAREFGYWRLCTEGPILPLDKINLFTP